MSVTLCGTIKSKFTKGGKNLQTDLEKLKESLLQKKRLQNGILQKAAELARSAISYTPDTSGHLTFGAYRAQLEHESKVLPRQRRPQHPLQPQHQLQCSPNF
ncbi:unnamed protein product [Mucor hiemalis]